MNNTMRQLLTALFCLVIATGCTRHSEPVVLTVLHTNDTHSQIEPDTETGKGGYLRRICLIKKERKADPDLILLDAGDFCQGTPYFNYFKGDVEIEAMNYMGYDAATIGNHEFDNGVEALADLLRKAEFPIVCANYKTEGTPIEGLLKPYTIITRKGVRIGIIGLGVKPQPLILASNFSPLVWQHPYAIADSLATDLKQRQHCNVVVCLSHLGTDVSHNDPDSICDIRLAKQSSDIDLIIGGHTHKEVNLRVKNKAGREVLLVQTGSSGRNLGKVTLTVGQ